MKIKNAHVLLTGANRGIGLGLAKELAQRGAHLHLQMRSESNGIIDELTQLGAGSVRVWIADLGTKTGVEKLVENLQTIDIDILINNAGQLTGGLLEEQPIDDIYSMFQVNIAALVHLTRGLLAGMIKRGRGKIVNNASVSSFMHFPCASTYSASKAAVAAFTACMQVELHDTGVSTLCLITPGIKTRMFDEIAVKYGKNLEVPQESITTEQYAVLICDAIAADVTELLPKGPTGIALKIARFLPGVFRKGVLAKFHR